MRWLVLSAGLAVCGSAMAAEKIVYGPPPTWVTIAEPQVAPATAENNEIEEAPAIEVVFSDSQSKFSAEGVSEYLEARIRVRTAEGLSVGSMAQEWDPATDTLSIHRLRIERGGEIIDVLRKQKFEVLRRERSLEQSMLDGRLTATLQIADLRVGDILDYAVTVSRAQPVLAGRNGTTSFFAPRLRVGKARVRMVWDKTAPVVWRVGDGLPKPKVTATPQGGGEMLLEVANLKGPIIPDEAPARYRFVGMVQASQLKNWSDASKAFLPLYQRASTLEPTSPLKAEVERIKRDASTPLARASLALKLVEDQVRYVAITMNAQGFTPATADDTWRRRFGDCKGKTAMLLALLRELGVEAAPALVSTTGGEALNSVLPRADAFDHVIVRAVINGKVYWLDGTRIGDGPVESLITPYYGWALPLTAQGSELERLRPARLERPTDQYTLRIDASNGFDKEAPVELEIISRAADAGAIALRYASTPKTQVRQAIIDQYASIYRKTEFKEAAWRYDADESRLTLTLKGTIIPDMRVVAGRKRYEVPGSVIYAPDLKVRPADQDQTAAYDVDDTSYFRQLTVIKLPVGAEDYEVRGQPTLFRLGGIQNTRWAAKEFGYVTVLQSVRGVVEETTAAERVRQVALARRMSASVAVITSKATAEEAEAADGISPVDAATPDDLNGEARNRLSSSVYVNIARQEEIGGLSEAQRGEMAAFSAILSPLMRKGDMVGVLAALDNTKLDSATFGDAGTFTRVAALMRLKRDKEAMTVADRAISGKPNADLYVLRAGLRRTVGDPLGAKADIDAALALDSMNLPALRLLTDDREVRNDKAAMIEVRRKITRVQPDEPEAWILLARAEAVAGHPVEAARAYQDAQEAGAIGVTALLPLGEALVALERKDEASRVYDRAVALRPDNSEVLNEACWARARMNVELPKALTECESAIRFKPGMANILDSRVFVKLRQGRFADAVSDYDLALTKAPTQRESLYGRGIAKLRLGQTAAGEADLAAALKGSPNVGRRFADYGVTP